MLNSSVTCVNIALHIYITFTESKKIRLDA